MISKKSFRDPRLFLLPVSSQPDPAKLKPPYYYISQDSIFPIKKIPGRPLYRYIFQATTMKVNYIFHLPEDLLALGRNISLLRERPFPIFGCDLPECPVCFVLYTKLFSRTLMHFFPDRDLIIDSSSPPIFPRLGMFSFLTSNIEFSFYREVLIEERVATLCGSPGGAKRRKSWTSSEIWGFDSEFIEDHSGGGEMLRELVEREMFRQQRVLGYTEVPKHYGWWFLQTPSF